MEKYKKKYKKQKGFTLIELLLVIPLVAIIFLISYNILFISSKSINYVNNSFNTSEDIRFFINNIQKEANQAKKALEDEGPLYKNSKNELYIYTDENGEKPELIRYRLKDEKILRDVKKATNDNYPYKFERNFKDEKIVLTNVKNTNIFGEVENIRDRKKPQEGEDYRQKLKLNIEIYTGENSTNMKISTYLISKSRAKFE